jgi:aspartyl-tRNA(Asn)/glutamyl-tRNA(Gln) amidotransferase subunit A
MATWSPITSIAADVKSGKKTAAGLVEQSLQAIEDNQDYKTVISVTAERARRRAKEIDEQVKKNEDTGPLTGVPFIAKDNFLTFESETTAASNILKGFKAPYQATAINKLEEAGAICVAKANLDAFAHGSSTENSDFFTTLNPHDKSRVPGGSSGGSAAAVMLNLAPFALGTDTGGSIRLPASFCGAVGLKPTYGLVSRSGVVAMASSTDVIGPITKTVDDAAIVLDVMSGKDGLDSTLIERDESPYTDLEASLKGKKIGIIKEYMGEGLDEDVRQVIGRSIDKIKKAGAEVSEISMPSLPLALAVYYIVCPAEVTSNLARYDGQRYGHSSDKAKNLDESYELSRMEGFGMEAKRRIMIGSHVLSSGYYDAYYKKAQTVRTIIVNEFKKAFARYDFLVGPTAPMTAFKIGERSSDPLKMYLSDILTVAVNMSGNPSISVPAGKSGNMPIGLQLIGPQKGDRALLGAAKAFEGLS